MGEVEDSGGRKVSDEEVEIAFKFPRELVEQANVVESRNYWERLVEDEDVLVASKMAYLTYLQILEWQEANRYRVTPDTPPGTEVEITDPDYRPEPLYRSWLVGPDPRVSGAVVTDELQGYLFVEWEHLRLVESLTEGDSNE